MTPDSSVLLRVSKAAEALDLSRAEVYKLVRRGHIRAIHIGSVMRIPRAELERFVAERLAVEHGDVGLLALERRGVA